MKINLYLFAYTFYPIRTDRLGLDVFVPLAKGQRSHFSLLPPPFTILVDLFLLPFVLGVPCIWQLALASPFKTKISITKKAMSYQEAKM